MCSGHLGKLEAVDKRIKVKRGTKQYHQMPYRKGLQIQENAAEAVKDQFGKRVIVPAS